MRENGGMLLDKCTKFGVSICDIHFSLKNMIDESAVVPRNWQIIKSDVAFITPSHFNFSFLLQIDYVYQLFVSSIRPHNHVRFSWYLFKAGKKFFDSQVLLAYFTFYTLPLHHIHAITCFPIVWSPHYPFNHAPFMHIFWRTSTTAKPE